jgi:hypothetical protein
MPVGVQIFSNGQKLQVDSQARCMHRAQTDAGGGVGIIIPVAAQGGDPAYLKRYVFREFLANDEHLMVGVPLLVGGVVEVRVGRVNSAQVFVPGYGLLRQVPIEVYARDSGGGFPTVLPVPFTFLKRLPPGAAGVGLNVAWGPDPSQTAFDSRAMPLSLRQKSAFAAGSAGSQAVPSGMTTPAVIGSASCSALEGWRYDYYVEPDPPFTTGGTFSQDYTRAAIGGWTLSAGGVLSRDARAFLAPDPNAGYFISVLSQTFGATQAMIYDQWRYA